MKKLVPLSVLLAGLGLIKAGPAAAQTLIILHSFTAVPDGGNPAAGLVLVGSALYGTARVGGSSNHGTVFALNTDGSGFTNLHSFSAMTYSVSVGAEVNGDGAYPYSCLVLSGNALYGTASGGGGFGVGTVFAVGIGAAAFRPVYSFVGYPVDASTPLAGLVSSGGSLYGVTKQGGNLDLGSVFNVTTNGTRSTLLYNFTGPDGCHLASGLVSAGSTLYGTAREGGNFNSGTVFKINSDGSGFTTLHNFNANSDGSFPGAGLVLSGNTLYGTAEYGGTSGNGTVFKLNIDGTSFTTLHSFTSFPVTGSQTNSDGANPRAGLIISGTTLYGTARLGGNSGYGTVFQLSTNGTGLITLHSFGGGVSDGANPFAELILSSNVLYGTTSAGGSAGQGTVFSLFIGETTPPQPSLVLSGANVILTWPTNTSGLTLQCTTNLASPTAWITASPEPVVVNGQNVVTNPISGTQQFYRLTQ